MNFHRYVCPHPHPHPFAAAVAPNSTVIPPLSYVYNPNYCHYFYEHLGRNRERNLGHIANVTFTKQADHTALRLTWEGNFRKQRCTVCCAEWFITINGAPCTSFEEVKTSIVSRTAYNIFFPTTLSGICHEVDGVPLTKGQKLLKLEVGNCDGSPIADGASGFSQSSRFTVEEIPRGEGSISLLHGILDQITLAYSSQLYMMHMLQFGNLGGLPFYTSGRRCRNCRA